MIYAVGQFRVLRKNPSDNPSELLQDILVIFAVSSMPSKADARQVPSSRDRCPQSLDLHPRTALLALLRPAHAFGLHRVDPVAPSPLVLRSQLFAKDFRKKVKLQKAKFLDHVFHERQVCHAKIQGPLKKLFDFCNFQGLFKKLIKRFLKFKYFSRFSRSVQQTDDYVKRRRCMKKNGKSPTFKFVSGEERRQSEV